MNKIDRRILRTQEAIKSTLLELMQKKEFDKITVREISEHANIGNRTFYLHYLDKYDVIEKMMSEHIENCRKICAPDTDDAIKNAPLLWLQYIEKHQSFFALMLSSNISFAFQKSFLALISEMVKKMPLESVYHDPMDLEAAYEFISFGVYGLAEGYIKGKLGNNLDQIAEQVNQLTQTFIK